MIVDLTQGKKSAELTRLHRLLKADVTVSTPSIKNGNSKTVFVNANTAEQLISSNADFLVILGEASAGLLNVQN